MSVLAVTIITITPCGGVDWAGQRLTSQGEWSSVIFLKMLIELSRPLRGGCVLQVEQR